MTQKIRQLFRKGFTLIELLVIVAIVCILVSVVVVSLFKSREKAKVVRFKEAVRSLQTKAIEVCPTSNNMGDFSSNGPYGMIPSSINTGGISGSAPGCGPSGNGSGIFTLNVPSVDIVPLCTAVIDHTGDVNYFGC